MFDCDINDVSKAIKEYYIDSFDDDSDVNISANSIIGLADTECCLDSGIIHNAMVELDLSQLCFNSYMDNELVGTYEVDSYWDVVDTFRSCCYEDFVGECMRCAEQRGVN